MVAPLGDDVQPLVPGDVQQVSLLHGARDLHRLGIDFIAVGGQGFGLGRHVQQLAQLSVRVPHGGGGGGHVDEGDAGLLLQGVQVLHDGLLGLAHVDDHLGPARKEGLQIQLALAAVELPEDGQIIIFFIEELFGGPVPRVGDARQLVRAQGEQHDLGERPADGHLIDGTGHRHGPAHRVGEGPRLGGLRSLGCGTGRGQQHQRRQQQDQDAFHVRFLLIVVYPGSG